LGASSIVPGPVPPRRSPHGAFPDPRAGARDRKSLVVSLLPRHDPRLLDVVAIPAPLDDRPRRGAGRGCACADTADNAFVIGGAHSILLQGCPRRGAHVAVVTDSGRMQQGTMGHT